MKHDNGGIYAIYDTVANELVGTVKLHIHKHPAAAVRFFSDVAADKNTSIGQHPQDYNLLCLGYLTLENNIEPVKPDDQVVITGQAWLAAQAPAEPKLVKES